MTAIDPPITDNGKVWNMAILLHEALQNAVMAHASPELVAGPPTALAREVSWVHSSDIYEIAPLLEGGELLLTTGLGIANADAGARRYWVRELSARKVSAVAVELGRSLRAIPDEVAEEAHIRELPVIALSREYPFARICRELNGLILDADAAALRISDAMTTAIHHALIANSSLAGVLSVASEQTGLAMRVYTSAGRVIAQAPAHVDPELRSGPSLRVSVETNGTFWGELQVELDGHSPRVVQMVAERTANAIAMTVMHLGRGSTREDDSAAELLKELASGTHLGEEDILVRSGMAGFLPKPGQNVVGVNIQGAETTSVLASLDSASGRLGQRVLRGRVGASVLALVTAPAADDPVGLVCVALNDALERAGLRNIAAVVGPVVPLADAGRTIREAGDAMTAAGRGVGVVGARNLALRRILTSLPADDLERIATDSIGALIRWDQQHGSSLVHTLFLFLRNGENANRVAAKLHLHRQSVHQRLQRINQLLGGRLDDPRSREDLWLATAAWSIRRRLRET